MEVCSKCLTPSDFLVKYTDLDEKWGLCPSCNRFFDTTAVWLREFMKDDFGCFPIPQISKDMINARKRRATGQDPWTLSNKN